VIYYELENAAIKDVKAIAT